LFLGEEVARNNRKSVFDIDKKQQAAYISLHNKLDTLVTNCAISRKRRELVEVIQQNKREEIIQEDQRMLVYLEETLESIRQSQVLFEFLTESRSKRSTDSDSDNSMMQNDVRFYLQESLFKEDIEALSESSQLSDTSGGSVVFNSRRKFAVTLVAGSGDPPSARLLSELSSRREGAIDAQEIYRPGSARHFLERLLGDEVKAKQAKILEQVSREGILIPFPRAELQARERRDEKDKEGPDEEAKKSGKLLF
jgi:hypothetical protein